MTTAVAVCPPHYWQIATPNGPEVEGVCKKCDEHRVYLSAGTIDDGRPLSDNAKKSALYAWGGATRVERKNLDAAAEAAKKRGQLSHAKDPVTGLTPMQAAVLEALVPAGSRVADVVRATGIGKDSIRSQLNALFALGLVRRETAPIGGGGSWGNWWFKEATK